VRNLAPSSPGVPASIRLQARCHPIRSPRVARMRFPVAVLTVALAALLVGAAVAPASVVQLFRTPTGNIGCAFSAGLPGAEKPTLRCDIRSRLRPEPRPPKSCPLDYGDAIEVSQLGPATLVCHGDTAIDPGAPVLAYGHSWRRGGISCTSRPTGLTCSNRSRHGFFLSRQKWQVF
jgi:uncharacterized protein DUF6636